MAPSTKSVHTYSISSKILLVSSEYSIAPSARFPSWGKYFCLNGSKFCSYIQDKSIIRLLSPGYPFSIFEIDVRGIDILLFHLWFDTKIVLMSSILNAPSPEKPFCKVFLHALKDYHFRQKFLWWIAFWLRFQCMLLSIAAFVIAIIVDARTVDKPWTVGVYFAVSTQPPPFLSPKTNKRC
jgi:hypothetical protein